MLVSTVSTVRTSKVDLQMFVNFHLNCGVDKMFLFFDDPDDEAIPFFQSDPRLVCIRCDEAYWIASQLKGYPSIEQRQIYNANSALRWAKEEGSGWIIHIDSDELVFAPNYDIKTSIAKESKNFDAITFPTYEAVPEPRYDKHFFQEIHWFRTETALVRAVQRVTAAVGRGRVIAEGYLRGHNAGKSAVRVNANIASLRIHFPVAPLGERLRITRSSKAVLLHFDCCTFDDWTLKWMRRYDGTATGSEMGETRKQQFARFIAAYETGDKIKLRETYDREYLLSEVQKVMLRALGLLRRVNVDEKRFVMNRP